VEGVGAERCCGASTPHELGEIAINFLGINGKCFHEFRGQHWHHPTEEALDFLGASEDTVLCENDCIVGVIAHYHVEISRSNRFEVVSKYFCCCAYVCVSCGELKNMFSVCVTFDAVAVGRDAKAPQARIT
jgi:hypothetical protein